MFACIYIPNFSVAAALRAEPELQARPLAIFEGKPPLEKIIAANEHSVKLGIAPGITKAQAELCSELALRPRSSLQEGSTHAALLDCAQSFSPCVEDSACDTALLDLRGMASLFGSITNISRALSERAIALGLQANVAIASNPDAALLAVRRLSRDHRNSRGQRGRAIRLVAGRSSFQRSPRRRRKAIRRFAPGNFASLGHSQPACTGGIAGNRAQ